MMNSAELTVCLPLAAGPVILTVLLLVTLAEANSANVGNGLENVPEVPLGGFLFAVSGVMVSRAEATFDDLRAGGPLSRGASRSALLGG